MRRWSPFTFSFDDPISFNDPFGMTPSDTLTRPLFNSGEPELDPNDPSGHTLAPVTVTASVKPSIASQIISWLPVISFASDSYKEFKRCNWVLGTLNALAGVGDALTFGEEGIVAHAGEEIIGHAAEETAEHAAVQVEEEEVAERAEQEIVRRPGYGKGQVEDVWDAAKQTDGKVYDPNTGEELFWDRAPQEMANGIWGISLEKSFKN